MNEAVADVRRRKRPEPAAQRQMRLVFLVATTGFVLIVAIGIVLVVLHWPSNLAPTVQAASRMGPASPPHGDVTYAFDNVLGLAPHLSTLTERALAGEVRAQERLGLALLDAAAAPQRAFLASDALHWLGLAHLGGSLAALDGLVRLAERHCADPSIREQALCDMAE